MNINNIRMDTVVSIVITVILFTILERIKFYNRGLRIFRSGALILYKKLLSTIWRILVLSNLDTNLGILKYVTNKPELHCWYHSTGKGKNRNFATKFSLWDFIFNTAYHPQNKKAENYGLKTYFPENYFRQFIYLFRPFKNNSK